MDEKYDTALLAILQNEGEIQSFLDVLMRFLYRKTDFFHILKDKTGNTGFPPGIALQRLVNAYKKYESLASNAEQHRENSRQNEFVKPKQKLTVKEISDDEVNILPPAVKEVEVSDIPQQSMEVSTEGNEIKNSNSAKQCEINDTELKKDFSNTPDIKKESQKGGGSGDKTEEEGEGLKEEQKTYQDNSESYNGAVRENYSWSQSITDLDITVEVPSHVKKGKDCQVVIEKKHLKVCYKDTSQQWQELVSGDLTWEINKEESMWSLTPSKNILINIEKRQERWWEAVLVNEPKISLKNIDASRPMTDLDNEAQSKIEEMMYNERQKKLGKPQTHEQKTHDILKKAWNAEGSPFKGQEFDPSGMPDAMGGIPGMGGMGGRTSGTGGMPGQGMADMPDVSALFNDPEILAALQEPGVKEAFLDIEKNPANIAKHQDNENVQAVIDKLSKKFQPGAAGGKTP